MEIPTRDSFRGLSLWRFCAALVELEIFSSPVYQKHDVVVLVVTVSGRRYP